MGKYRRNHYVPIWYQERFLPLTLKERKFHYLDLKPETVIAPTGHRYKRNELLRWGPPSCFYQDDLYTTRFGNFESTEIEEMFFGRLDNDAPSAVEHYATFEHPNYSEDAFRTLLPYMSVQKMRTPKGLAAFAEFIRVTDPNVVLFKLQELRQMWCATWTDCVWLIADASQSATKFIVTDHPVTVYNAKCFPASDYCKDVRDPDIRLRGTHTLFPLSLDKIMIFTNLSWVRDPYANPLTPRPHPVLFRQAMFDYRDTQVKRMLSEQEVREINFVLKQRAYRYVAAAEKDWLYPEQHLRNTHWDKLGDGILFMPDPRSMTFSSEIIIGYKDGTSTAFDAHGRRPWHAGFSDKEEERREMDTFSAFQGEFARRVGPKRRGRSFQFDRLSPEEDDPEYHKHHLKAEGHFKQRMRRG